MPGDRMLKKIASRESAAPVKQRNRISSMPLSVLAREVASRDYIRSFSPSAFNFGKYIGHSD